MEILINRVLPDTFQVVALVFVMMVLVDLLNVVTRGRIVGVLRGAAPWRQYVVAGVVGVIPGCLGAFTVVSLYTHGMISFGALTGAMLASSGDEAFVMIAMFPKTAIFLFFILAILGMGYGWIVDKVVKRFSIPTCEDCPTEIIHPAEGGWRHYLRGHVWQHIIRKHLWRTALWTLGALALVQIGMQHTELAGLAQRYPLLMLLLAGLLGLIPESGPHLVIVSMYASHLVPFSVLLTSAIVQDGHGMLPMLAYSVRASLVLKAFKLVFGLSLGLIVYLTGH